MTEHAVTYKELRRTRDDRMIAGVCGGLARYFDVNPTFYRVGFVVLTILGGAGILIYGAALLVMPDEGQRDSIASEVLRERHHRPWSLAGLALVAVAGIVLLSRLSFHIHSGTGFWIVVLIIGGVLLQWQQRTWWHWHRRSRGPAGPEPSPPPPSPEPDLTPPTAESVAAPASPQPDYHAYVESWYARPRRGSFGITFGVLVVAGGLLGLLAAAGVHIPWAVALGVGAVAIGFGIVSGAILGRRVGGVAFLGLLLAAIAVIASTVHLHLGGGVGNRTYTPAAAARPDYRLGIGNLHLDLSNVSLSAPQTKVDARVGIGNLDVIVPQGVSVRIVGSAGVGDVMLLGHDANGHRVDETVSIPGGVVAPKLVIEARTDIGRVRVTRSAR